MTVEIERLTGTALRDALPDLARLRMKVFSEWPYLYAGSLEYEEAYIRSFAANKGAVIIAARDGAAIVGAATGCPLAGHAKEFAAPFLANRYDVETIFYFGESALLPEYRRRGLGHAFFDHREAHARGLGGFTHATFCGVVRPDNFPMRPRHYFTLDEFWSARGYAPVDGLVAHFTWPDIGATEPTVKPMQFWMKAL